MKTAVVCLTTKQELQKAATLLVQAGTQYPGAQPVFCLLDCGVPHPRPQNYLFVSGEAMLGEEYYSYAFALRREEYTALCMVRVVQGLLREYDNVIVAKPYIDMQQLPKFGYAKDTVMLSPKQADSAVHPLPLEASLQNFPLYENQFCVFCKGEKTGRFLAWCAAKMTHIMHQGVQEDKQTSNGACVSQRAFFNTWLSYASLFGCAVVPLTCEHLAQNIPATAYAFDTFRDGTPIPLVLRIYYGTDYRLQRLCKGTPFTHLDAFTDVSCVTGDEHPVPIVPAAMALYRQQHALRRTYPSLSGDARLEYLHWYVAHAPEEGMHSVFTDYTKRTLAAYEAKQQEEQQLRGKANKTMADRLKTMLAKQEEEAAEVKYPFGINLIGFITADSSAGENVRSLARVLQAAEVPFSVTELRTLGTQAYTNNELAELITNELPYGINLFALNPVNMEICLGTLADSVLENRYNVGYWTWPLAQLTTQWAEKAAVLDEIWTPSSFTTESVRQSVHKQVCTVPYAVSVQKEPSLSRADFGLPEDKFIVLAMADLCQNSPLHNLQAAVDAFSAAFAGNDKVQLVLKLNTPPGWNGEDGLQESTHSLQHVQVLTDVLTQSAVNSLMSLCDVYISLHHATAFGYGAAQAMAMGKPVVLTGYGGCTQYMRQDACCPVAFTLGSIPDSAGEYAGGKWAQPSVSAASGILQRLVRDTMLRAKVGIAGKHVIEQEFSPAAIGAVVRARVAALRAE